MGAADKVMLEPTLTGSSGRPRQACTASSNAFAIAVLRRYVFAVSYEGRCYEPAILDKCIYVFIFNKQTLLLQPWSSTQ
jgi:hypothetical protein